MRNAHIHTYTAPQRGSHPEHHHGTLHPSSVYKSLYDRRRTIHLTSRKPIGTRRPQTFCIPSLFRPCNRWLDHTLAPQTAGLKFSSLARHNHISNWKEEKGLFVHTHSSHSASYDYDLTRYARSPRLALLSTIPLARNYRSTHPSSAMYNMYKDPQASEPKP
jgi:hypothetical protein